MDIWQELVKLEATGTPAALVTVIKTKGSTPREVGAKMIVYHDGRTAGTIGGSAVETLIAKDAVAAINEGKPRSIEYSLDDLEKSSTGMICGGMMEFFIEPLKSFPRLYIFGGGHVGYAIAAMADVLGYPYTIIDERAEFASHDRFPRAADLHTGDYIDIVPDLDFVQPACLMILTHSHDCDYEVLKQVIRKPFQYLGMICSKRKKGEMWKKLEAEGFTKEELAQVHAPIGLDIGSNTPAEIAISILAEIISEFQKKK